MGGPAAGRDCARFMPGEARALGATRCTEFQQVQRLLESAALSSAQMSPLPSRGCWLVKAGCKHNQSRLGLHPYECLIIPL
jgi:hypothetical protein